MLIALVSELPAVAGDTVLVAAGDATLARERLAAALGTPADQIKVVALADVLPKEPLVAVGAGRVEACKAAPSTNAEVKVAVDAADRHVAYMELDQALVRLDEAAGRLVCLSEPADNKLAARIHFLHGVVAHAKGDGATAQAAFRQAKSYVPDLTWDPNFPPDAVPLFEAAATASSAPGHLAVVPSPSVVFVDGQVKGGRLDLPPGIHLVQFGEPLVTWRAFVDPGGTMGLVRPSVVPPDALTTWSKDPAKRNDLALVLGAAFGPGVPLYVDDTESTWSLTTAGSTAWTPVAGVAKGPLESASSTPNLVTATTTDAAALVTSVATVIDDTHDEAFDEGKKGAKRGVGSALLATGALVFAGGSIVAGMNYGGVTAAVSDATAAADGNDFAGYEAAATAYEKHRGMYTVGLVVAAVGAGTAAGGLMAFVDAGPILVRPGAPPMPVGAAVRVGGAW